MTTTQRLDLYKLHKDEYRASNKGPTLVAIGPAKYLAVDGTGPPDGEDFEGCMQALYPVAYTQKFQSKAAGRDYVVCKLEGLWRSFSEADADWSLLVRVPEFVTQEDRDAAVAAVLEKKKSELADRVRLLTLEEGRCVQGLHVGPYADEQRTIDVLAAFAEDQGLELVGPHHEIYLSDPRRVEPEKLKTILRYPVRARRD